MAACAIRWAVGLAVACCLVPASGAALAAAKAEAGADTAKPAADEAAVQKMEKQVAGVQDRMSALQQEEFNISMVTLKGQQAAIQGIEGQGLDKVRDELAKGSHNKEHLEYRAAMLAAAQQWQAFAEKYSRVLSMIKTLERDRDKAPAEMQTKIDELSKRAQDKYRSLLEKVADFYDKCAEFRQALQIYASLYQSLPENKRDRGLKEKLGDLYERTGDLKSALALYKGIFDAIPEKARFKDKNACLKLAGVYEKMGDVRNAALIYKGFWDAVAEKDRTKERSTGEKLGDICEKAGDMKSALDLYKACLASIPADKQEKDGAGLRKKIYNLEIKLGLRKGSPVADAAAASSSDNERNYGRRR
ncbi:MAG: tetratricopeptide repeat protein [Planctomycetes bacterium]|nr:tetratricopeptide repeat protein [Planctomycetota bacterium]